MNAFPIIRDCKRESGHLWEDKARTLLKLYASYAAHNNKFVDINFYSLSFVVQVIIADALCQSDGIKKALKYTQ